jgi:8-oxo-dGTP pyrophosphatase MutT (NUDIX family)
MRHGIGGPAADDGNRVTMSKAPTRRQVSAGGVAYRERDGRAEVALIRAGDAGRWQLPKGIVEADESSEEAALREVREETGLCTELVALIDRIDYWYYGHEGGERVRYHKLVDLYLLRYRSGSTSDHDSEVQQARWVTMARAQEMLAFDNEREIVRQARGMMAS